MNLKEDSNFIKFTCEKHKRQIDFIYLKDDKKGKLACSRCSLEQRLDYQYIIDIEQLLEQKEETIFNNLPPCLSKESIAQLNSPSIQKSSKVNLINEVDLLFEKYTEVILSAIKEHKIKIFNQINLIEDQRVAVIQTYNIISSKEDLHNRVIELSNQNYQLEKYLKDLISSKKSSLEQDKKIIEDSLQIYQQQAQKINLDNIQNHLKSIIENIKSTNFFSIFYLNSHPPPSSSSSVPSNYVQLNQINNQNMNAIIPNSFQQLAQLSIPIISSVSIPPFPMIEKQIEINSLYQSQSMKNMKLYKNIQIDFRKKPLGDNEIQLISNCLEGCYLTNQFALVLEDNNINNSGIVKLLKVLEQMKQITSLTYSLYNNKQISELGFYESSKSLQFLSNTLTYLELALSESDNITDQVIETSIIPFISSQTNLSLLYLDLTETKIGGNAVRQIANALKDLLKLETLMLYLSKNQIEDDNAFTQLSNQIQCMKQPLDWVELYLNKNQISDQCALSLTNVLSTCSNLKSIWLDFSDNKIGEQSKKQIIEILSILKENRKEEANVHLYLDGEEEVKI